MTLPVFTVELIQELLPAALLISLVGFLESVEVAKSLASKRRQKIDADQELIALGAANIGASVTGGYAVTGGFSRSLVNFTSGVVTPLSSIIVVAMLTLGIEIGIVIGAGLSIVLYLWRTSRPPVAVVGRVGQTEHYRNVLRLEVQTTPHVLAVRIDESLYFANSATVRIAGPA